DRVDGMRDAFAADAGEGHGGVIARRLRGVEAPHIGDRDVDGGERRRRECLLRRGQLRLAHPEAVELYPVVARGELDERRIAVTPDLLDDAPHLGAALFGIAQHRTREQRFLLVRVQRLPAADGKVHGFAPQASIFSTGRTSSELAPASLRFSSVSQNTFSRHTACTATLSCRPSSGMIVGASDPGSRRVISARRARGACSMMYLLSRTCSTPSSRCRIRSTHCCFAGSSGAPVRTTTASLSSTVSTSRSWFAASVAPVETRSHTKSARPSFGAIST